MTASQNVEVKLSPIQGVGIFALRSFCAEDIIRRVNVVREVTEEHPLRPERGEYFEHCAYPEDKVVLYGFPDRHFNHSCDPNAYEAYVGGNPTIRAIRTIRIGEEITVDYNINSEGGDSWPCHCGAARCRGEILGSYFRLPLDIQVEYLPRLAEWFVVAHESRIKKIMQAST